jgi:hypothetical protein
MSECQTDSNQVKVWRSDGCLHREDGPAVVYPNGDLYWYQFGERHRTDGPAIEYPAGDVYWFLNGVKYNFADWLEKNTYISDQEKVMMTLIYG